MEQCDQDNESPEQSWLVILRKVPAERQESTESRQPVEKANASLMILPPPREGDGEPHE